MLSGAEVVRRHKAAIDECKNKTGWDALACIVDSMHKQYKG